METLSKKQRLSLRFERLKTERSSWDTTWREISDFIAPRRARFFSSDRNRGERKDRNIINNTATRGLQVLRAGMMAGITPRSRPWFQLTTPDAELAEFGAVKQWLAKVDDKMSEVMQRSNIYNGFHQLYGDVGGFGTSVLHIDEDPEDLIRAYVFPLGQYVLANSARQKVDTCFREMQMTVRQLVEMFTEKSCSRRVREMYRKQNFEELVDVMHVLEPNRDYRPGVLGAKGQRISSCWFEKSFEAGEENLLLREAGYEESPFMAPRWDVTGEDVYGKGPGEECLGDVRALQRLEKRAAQLADKLVNPPMVGPSALRNQRVSLLPGDITYVDAQGAGATLRPAIDVRAEGITVLDAKIMRHEGRIDSSLHRDLFLMLAESDRRQITAREVAERHEEKLVQLGPVMESLGEELLDPVIDRVFGVLTRSGMLPPPPDELQGMPLRVKYISILAQAQKLLGITGIERLTSFVGGLAAVKPEVLDKVDFDQAVDKYADALGVDPSIVRSDDQVQEIRDARAQAAQKQQALEAAGAAAQGAKVLSETDTSGDNALTRLLGQYGAAPSA